MPGADRDIAPGVLVWLQGWYASNCDGDWEHGSGVVVETLDNPGWGVKILLRDTAMQDRPFIELEIDRAEHDWVRAWVRDGHFEAFCGPLNLAEALAVFRDWVQEST